MTKDIIKEKYRCFIADKLTRGDIITVAKKAQINYTTVWHQMKGKSRVSVQVIDATLELIKEKEEAEKGILEKMEL